LRNMKSLPFDAHAAQRTWIGPFQVRELLTRCLDESFPRPPVSGSAYLVSRHAWAGVPDAACGPLYVGGNTSRSPRFRARVGSLIADLFGFYSERAGHHSGGQSLHRWCRANDVQPLDLFIAWVDPGACHRCLEIDLERELSPALNRKAPARCEHHSLSRGADQPAPPRDRSVP
jgi:hypothetical protein